MLAVHGARERSVADFCRLFAEADSGYRYLGVTGGEDGAFQSSIEFEYKKQASEASN